MSKLKLTYFDFDGGRGEAVRLALAISNVPFEDERVTQEGWKSIKSQQPFGALPVLTVDGKQLAQSGAIMRYVGKLTDLYPSDPWQAAVCDQVIETVEEVSVHIGSTIPLSENEKKIRREALVADALPNLLGGLEKILKSNGNEFFVNGRLTVADMRVADLTHWFKSGMLDYIPLDLVDRFAPSLIKHMDMIKNEPRIKAYYQKRQVSK